LYALLYTSEGVCYQQEPLAARAGLAVIRERLKAHDPNLAAYEIRSMQHWVDFQPSLGSIQEFKIDNSTFSAEYGQNSGAVVNVATRSGANEFHGE
jgi:hypothetical protein